MLPGFSTSQTLWNRVRMFQGCAATVLCSCQQPQAEPSCPPAPRSHLPIQDPPATKQPGAWGQLCP